MRMYLVQPVLQYQTTNSQYAVIITVIALSTPNKIGGKKKENTHAKYKTNSKQRTSGKVTQ